MTSEVAAELPITWVMCLSLWDPDEQQPRVLKSRTVLQNWCQGMWGITEQVRREKTGQVPTSIVSEESVIKSKSAASS